jgi:transposase
MNAYPGPRNVLVMDNCSVHHVPEVAEKCDEKYVLLLLSMAHKTDDFIRGVKLLYLPPYSPDLNPIEEAFSFIKTYIRRHGLRFRDLVASGDPANPLMFLYEAMDQVTLSAAKGWISHSGYM